MKILLPDELDKFIFYEIIRANQNKEELTTWQIAKRYIQLTNKNNLRTKDIEKKFAVVRWRMEKYFKEGFFEKKFNGDGKPAYALNLNSITIKKHKFPKDGLKEALIVRI